MIKWQIEYVSRFIERFKNCKFIFGIKVGKSESCIGSLYLKWEKIHPFIDKAKTDCPSIWHVDNMIIGTPFLKGYLAWNQIQAGKFCPQRPEIKHSDEDYELFLIFINLSLKNESHSHLE